MIIHVAQVLLDDNTLGSQFTMVFGIKRGIQRYKLIRHDTTATIDDAMLAQRLVFQGISEMHAVGICQFATLQAVQHIHRVILIATFGVRLLDTTA